MSAKAIEIIDFDIRRTSSSAFVAEIAKVGTKAATRIPGLAVHVDTEDLGLSRWCSAHRSWCSDRHEVCSYRLGSGPGAEIGACSVAPAEKVRVVVTATGLPMWGDWEVYAILTTSSTDATIASNTINRGDMVPAEHIALAGQCAHCRTNRRRKTTALLRNINGGEVRPVGGSCLAEYTGSKLRFQALSALTGLAERFKIWHANAVAKEPCEAPIVEVVALAMRYIALDGKFVPSNDYGSKVRPTSQRVREAIAGSGNTHAPIIIDNLTEKDRQEARAAIKAILSAKADSGYMVNLQTAASGEFAQVDGKGNVAGLLASLPGAAERQAERAERMATWEKEKADREKEKDSRTNSHIGAIKERREFQGVIRSASTHSGDFGSYEVVTIDTAGGALKIMGTVNWPANVGDDENLAGRSVTLTGTITKHEEYRGERQTRINRVKVTKVA